MKEAEKVRTKSTKEETSTLRIVRAALGYGVIVVVLEEEAKYFLYNDNIEGFGKGEEGVVLKEVSRDTARQYFGGQADGMGFGLLPKQAFQSLDEAIAWIKKAQEDFHKRIVVAIKEVEGNINSKALQRFFRENQGLEPRDIVFGKSRI
jgi:hypothetical protein